MPKKEGGISKTQRILSVYHLLIHCREVSMNELFNNLAGCKKTFSRDIKLLKQSGVPVRFSVKRQAFVLSGDYTEPEYPESKKARMYIDKIIRLTTIMDDMPESDCDVWYRESFPEVSQRTMQRDFAILNSIGYGITYEREEFNCHDAGFDVLVKHYYLDRPEDAYSLKTYK